MNRSYESMESESEYPISAIANEIPPRKIKSAYPEPFASRMKGREKRALGEYFGITHFGVNLTRLDPGAQSALLHKHSVQQEFIYILEGEPTLITDSEEVLLQPGMCAGFTPGGPAHQLQNRTDKPVIYIEVGDRTPADSASYPEDDLVAQLSYEGKWEFTRKNGEPY